VALGAAGSSPVGHPTKTSSGHALRRVLRVERVSRNPPVASRARSAPQGDSPACGAPGISTSSRMFVSTTEIRASRSAPASSRRCSPVDCKGLPGGTLPRATRPRRSSGGGVQRIPNRSGSSSLQKRGNPSAWSSRPHAHRFSNSWTACTSCPRSAVCGPLPPGSSHPATGTSGAAGMRSPVIQNAGRRGELNPLLRRALSSGRPCSSGARPPLALGSGVGGPPGYGPCSPRRRAIRPRLPARRAPSLPPWPSGLAGSSEDDPREAPHPEHVLHQLAHDAANGSAGPAGQLPGRLAGLAGKAHGEGNRRGHAGFLPEPEVDPVRQTYNAALALRPIAPTAKDVSRAPSGQ
jgi:hypothetical protein